MIRWVAICAALVFCGCTAGTHDASPNAAATKSRGKNTVVWLSVDGFRHDYMARIQPQALSRLAHEGAMTTRSRPTFPSITFPSHISQVTGVGVDRHGVPFNNWMDTSTGEKYSFPNDSSLIRAEPIWVTAKRQGIRVAALNWPMSYVQVGKYKSDYFLEKFEGDKSDDERLKDVVKILYADAGSEPLRLVITYMSHLDSTGHRFGPESEEVATALRRIDGEIDTFIKSIVAWFEATHSKEDELFFIITTDHGMEKVHTRVNVDRIIGADLMRGATVITGGPVASIHLNDVPVPEKQSRAEAIIAKLNKEKFVKAWKQQDFPAKYHYRDATRLGEVIAMTPVGYTFTGSRTAVTQPVAAQQVGVHGYDVDLCPNMNGVAIVWRYRHPLGGRDLGPVDGTQWHATVAKLLGIQNAPGSDPRALAIGK